MPLVNFFSWEICRLAYGAEHVASVVWRFLTSTETTNVVLAASTLATAFATCVLAYFNWKNLQALRQQSRDSLLSSMVDEQRAKEEACGALIPKVTSLKNDAARWCGEKILNVVSVGQLPPAPVFTTIDSQELGRLSEQALKAVSSAIEQARHAKAGFNKLRHVGARIPAKMEKDAATLHGILEELLRRADGALSAVTIERRREPVCQSVEVGGERTELPDILTLRVAAFRHGDVVALGSDVDARGVQVDPPQLRRQLDPAFTAARIGAGSRHVVLLRRSDR